MEAQAQKTNTPEQVEIPKNTDFLSKFHQSAMIFGGFFDKNLNFFAAHRGSDTGLGVPP